MSKRRVVVTGLGIISPLGSSIDTAWAAALRGESGIGLISRFDTSQFATRIGGAVRGFKDGMKEASSDKPVDAAASTVAQSSGHTLEGEVKDLRDGTGALEERARYELGMVKDDEVFVQFVAPAPKTSDTPPPPPPAGQKTHH